MTNVFLFILLAGFWGGSFVAIRYVVMELPPVFGAMCRLIVAVSTLTFIYLLQKRPLTIPKKYLLKTWVTGIFSLGLPFSLLFWAEQKVSPGFAGIINGTMPIWTSLLSLLFLRDLENFSERKILGLILGFAGIFVIFFPALDFASHHTNVLHTSATVLVTLSYTVGTILGRQLLAKNKDLDLYACVYQQHVISLIFLFVVSFALEDWSAISLKTLSYQPIVAIFYLGICSTGLAMVFYYHLLKTWGAIRASTITYLIPGSALILDALLLNNYPTRFELIGFIVILLAIFLIQTEKRVVKEEAVVT